jgi:hypothetical protein
MAHNPPDTNPTDWDYQLQLMRYRAYEHGYEDMSLLARDQGPGAEEEYRRGLADGGHFDRLEALDNPRPAPSPKRRTWPWSSR